MKVLPALLPLALLVFGSCEEPFTPKAPFEPRTVVTCIADSWGDVFSVTATVSQTYDVKGIDPMTNAIDPCDTNAVIRVTVDGIKYLLKKRSAERRDSSRYTTRVYTYGGGVKFTPLSSRKISLEVTTGSGRKLTSETKVPLPRVIEDDYRFPHGVTALTVRPKWTFSWDAGQQDDYLYFPRMLLYYYIDGDTLQRSIEIPMTYVEKDGKQIPVFPKFTRDKQVSYDFAAMTTAIASISAGDPVKSRYKISMLTISLVQYDEHLSKYYASMHGYLDEYSIRVDETTYSNITGGIGIFGSYAMNSNSYQMKEQYVKSFGYELAAGVR